MKNTQARNFCFIFTALASIGLSLTAFLNYWIDPFQLNHYDPKLRLWDNISGGVSERFQVAGFIRSFPFDEIVIGTSMTQNTSLETLRHHFHHNPIRLSMCAATIATQSLALECALKSGKAKHVIWGLDQVYLDYTDQDKYLYTPVEIFKNTPKLVLTYYFNIRVLTYSLIALRDKLRSIPPSLTVETFGNWYEKAEFCREIVLSLYDRILKRPLQPSEKNPLQKIDHQIANLQHDVLTLIRAYPDVDFKIFFPPYSLAYHKLMYTKNPDQFLAHNRLRKVLMEELTSIPNVKLYDFEIDKSIIQNLDNYSDLNHYSEKINDYIVDAMNRGHLLVTKSNIEDHIKSYADLPNLPYE